METKVNVVTPDGTMVKVSSNIHSEQGLRDVIKNRQEIAANYCNKNGWPTDPTKLSFEQIIKIRKTKEWIDAGK